MKTFWTAILVITLLLASFFAGRITSPCPVLGERIDTLTIRDTIRDTVLIPKTRYITRTDTVLLQMPGDTVKIEVEVPIERKVYQTEDYKATIEGFRPELVDMEVYRQTQYITRTEILKVPDKRKWGIGVQVGYGYNSNKFSPYIGIGVQYDIVSW